MSLHFYDARDLQGKRLSLKGKRLFSWHGLGVTPPLSFLPYRSSLECPRREDTYPGRYLSLEYVPNRGNMTLNGAKFCLMFRSWRFTVWYVPGWGVISCYQEKDQYIRGWYTGVHRKPSKYQKTRIALFLFMYQPWFNHLELQKEAYDRQKTKNQDRRGLAAWRYVVLGLWKST